MLEGVVVVDKPRGLTSHDVVSRVKKIYKAKKAGHSGTLDPLATGVLAVMINDATRLSDRLMAGDKEYEVEILFGLRTTTYDIEGDCLERGDLPDSLDGEVKKLLPQFLGEIDQVPPYYSAVKYQGKPLYKWAREGKYIDLPPRKVVVNYFNILSVGVDVLVARIGCSKGTYIRSICNDLGSKLGSGAVMKALRRLRTGPFSLDDAVSLELLERLSSEKELEKYLFTKSNFLC